MTSILTSKVTTLEVLTPSVAMRTTWPGKVLPGKASAVMSAGWPARISPMSLSSTLASTKTRERSETVIAVVPPPTLLMPEEMICPS